LTALPHYSNIIIVRERKEKQMITVTVYDPMFNWELVTTVKCNSYTEAAIYEEEFVKAGFKVEISD
jgi:hypothetical protein